MAEMFHESEDQNGVRRSINAHPIHEYTHAPTDQRLTSPHWMAGHDGREGYLEPAAQDLVHKTKDQVFKRLDGTHCMTFESELLPRAERLSRLEAGRPIEAHAPGCYCDKCQPPQGPMAATPAATRPVRKY